MPRQGRGVRALAPAVLISGWAIIISCGTTHHTSASDRAGASNAPATVPTAAEHPAVLFASPNGVAGIDLTYLRELRDRGFEVDYTDKLDEITAGRLHRFNAVVLFVTPDALEVNESHPLQADGDTHFVQVVEQYVSNGGGVFLMPGEMNIGKQQLGAFTDRWGARLPAELLVEGNPKNLTSPPRLRGTRLAFTDNILPSPVTQDVRGLWYPCDVAYLAAMTEPLVVNDDWQVVARASSTTTTRPIDVRRADAAPGLLVRTQPERAPAIMAIRTFGRGRVALIAEWPQFSVGSGTKWIYDRTVLDRGVAGRRSDFARLVSNTFRWLSEPSLRDHLDGGFVTNAARLVGPNAREDIRAAYRSQPPHYDAAALAHVPSTGQKLFRGLIGARTAYSSGRGTVADYAKAARQAGLDFVVFLENFPHFSAEKLRALTSDCAKSSGPDLLLLPGFSVSSNIGNHLFFFSPQPKWPPDQVLTGPAKNVLYVQEQDASGDFTGFRTPFPSWVLQNYHVDKGQAGYYDFVESPHGIRLHDARLYGMVGLQYFRDGHQVEDVTGDYLTTAGSTSPPAPAVVDEVNSPEELLREARSGHALTYAQAASLDANAPNGIFHTAMRWSHQYDAMPIFVSSGPKILSWAGCSRVLTFGAEGFVPERAVVDAPMHVASDVGLQDITIYDGDRLFRRFLLHGALSFEQHLVLDADVQRNLVVVARDRRGGVAVTFARRSWAEGGLAPTFCSDHINDCGHMLLAHGPWSLPLGRAPELSPDLAGATWDGGPTGVLPVIQSQETLPTLVTADGEWSAERLDPIPRLDFSDEGAVGVESLRQEAFDPRLKRVVNPWHTFGPLDGPAPLFDDTQQYREWLAATDGAPTTGWAAVGVRNGTAPSLFRNILHFKKPAALRSITLARLHVMPGDVLVIGDAGESRKKLTLDGKSDEATVCSGCWFGIYATKQAKNAFLFENRGERLRLRVGATVDVLAESLQPVRHGDDYIFELAAMAFPLTDPIRTDAQLATYVAYLRAPVGLQVLRGRRTPSPGLLDVAADSGAAELSIPRAQGLAKLTLPLRVTGLNPRWSAGVFQIDGYSAGFYGPGHDRYRALAVDAAGTAYVPMYVGRADLTHMRLGHLVVADARGRDLFIQVTCLGGTPFRWHVSVNNPTDRAITTTLRQAIDIPGLDLRERKVNIPAGAHIVLE